MMFDIYCMSGAKLNDKSCRLVDAIKIPDIYARELRKIYRNNLATTWTEYFGMEPHERINTLFIEHLLITNTECSADEAERLSQEVLPELWGDYWEALPFTATAE